MGIKNVKLINALINPLTHGDVVEGHTVDMNSDLEWFLRDDAGNQSCHAKSQGDFCFHVINKLDND